MTPVTRLAGLCGWCLGIALFLSSVAPAGAQPVRSAIPAGIQTAEFDKFPFPKTLAGLPRIWKIDYGVPGLGFSVLYGKPGDTWADIYVYDKRLDLTSAPPLPLARKELEVAIDDVHTGMRAGSYQSVVLQDESVSGAFAQAHLKITQAGKERDSFVFVTVRRSKFVKIRLTSSAGANAKRIAASFLAEYDRALSRR